VFAHFAMQIRAERDAIAARHTTALRDLQRLPAFLRLLGLHVLQVSQLRGCCSISSNSGTLRTAKRVRHNALCNPCM
jgi:hypothetical protein